jgi:nucleoside-diphosphate-sugar epimerase
MAKCCLGPLDKGEPTMKIVVVGAGTIGRRLVPALRSHGHDVIVAGRTSGDVHVDLTAHATIEAHRPAPLR